MHHGRNPRHLDTNCADVLIIRDRMFGTFLPELEQEKPDCGLVENLGTFNPIRVAIHEWVGIWRDIPQPMLSARARLIYALALPGWSHDASRDISLVIKTRHPERTPEDKGTPGFS